MRRRHAVRLAQYLFLLIGLAALGYYALVWVKAKRYQAREERTFQKELRARQAAPHPAIPPPPMVLADGSLMGRLMIPRIHLSVMVVQGDNDSDLRRAVGHIPGTALPGQNGNVAIAGHRDTFFRPLRFIRPGDTILLKTLQGTYSYQVTRTNIVKPDDVQVLYPTGHNTLTLVTCFPFYYVGSAPDRFIVSAQAAPGSNQGLSAPTSTAP